MNLVLVTWRLLKRYSTEVHMKWNLPLTCFMLLSASPSCFSKDAFFCCCMFRSLSSPAIFRVIICFSSHNRSSSASLTALKEIDWKLFPILYCITSACDLFHAGFRTNPNAKEKNKKQKKQIILSSNRWKYMKLTICWKYRCRRLSFFC